MVTAQPFRALRPASEAAERVASVPYDVVSTDEARALADGNPDSFLRVVRPEVTLPPGADPYAPETYARAAAELAALIDRGALIRDPEPALYAYRQAWRGRAQTGLVACCAVDEYDDDTIKKHEKTRPDKEDDRTRHALALSAHAGPVFLTYRGRAEIDRRVAAATAGEPLYDFKVGAAATGVASGDDAVRHTVWRVTASEAVELAGELATVDAAYVADGHHRSAAYSRARAELQRTGEGGSEADRFLAVLFPADQLSILPYNRVVYDLGGQDERSFLARLRETVEVSGPLVGEPREPAEAGRVGLYVGSSGGGTWYEMRLPADRLADTDPVASLDAAILQDLILGPLLGIDDPRTSPRIDFVGGIRGLGELERRADPSSAGGPGVAFALHPLSIEQLMAVADAGRVLPPKSTWFEPKLRSGLLIHEF